MAEVLSQSQIDALLNAARSGEMDVNSNDDSKSKQRDYPKYDFYSPKKFTRDRLKMISSIFESYVRILSSQLNTILHANCELEVDTVEEQRYFEFSNALTEHDVLTVVYDTREQSTESEPILFHITTGVMVNMLDYQLGGKGGSESEISSDYEYTDIELRLYSDFMQTLVENLSSAWKNYITIGFRMQRIEVNPTLVQLIGVDEAVVIVGITVRMPTISGRLSVCLPGTLLGDIFNEMNRETASQRQLPSKHDSDGIMEYLRDSELEIIAELEHTFLKIGDILHLHVGDVIDLGQPKNSKIFLKIEEKRWFDGYMGIYKKNKAVRIDQTMTVEIPENLQDKGED